ncbi:hypothetical protein, partial [Pseudomonas veronii]|uniref:hypothetical protein n=1 Tax=Pseudomonas veronii TaxID=76761 RepID=UPI001C43656E
MSLNIPKEILASTEKRVFGETHFSLKIRQRNFKNLYQIIDIWIFPTIGLWLKNCKTSCQEQNEN